MIRVDDFVAIKTESTGAMFLTTKGKDADIDSSQGIPGPGSIFIQAQQGISLLACDGIICANNLKADCLTLPLNGQLKIEFPVSGTFQTFTSEQVLLVLNTVLASDNRYKNIHRSIPADESLTKITALEPKEFEFTNGLEDIHPGVHRGLVAQELEEIFPEAVVSSPTYTFADSDRVLDDLKAINYSKLIVDLIGAIKELKALVEGLDDRLTDLEF